MAKWQPSIGNEALGVVTRNGLEPSAATQTIKSAAEILGSGINPSAGAGRSTGLIVGYVQSGKTLSFTTVIGLARDNGFPIVIVVAGNKTSLLEQSHARLARDLAVDEVDGLPQWILAQNPKGQDSQEEQLLRRTIDNWRDSTLEADERPTLLLTVLKQKDRLGAVTKLLQRFDLTGVPALIIDDEADQASLNALVNRGQESSTYRHLCDLRDALPCHTFLQYTATPQAPLLINIADTLSPNFVHVLEPGKGYVGGEEFFAPGSKFIESITDDDVQVLNSGQSDPPPSFVRAMRVFFVGLAVAILQKTGRRSMLIHPARERAIHQESAEWAAAVKLRWEEAFKLNSRDPKRLEALNEFFEPYSDLARTDKNLPAFELLAEKLPRAFRNTTIIEFNTRGQPKTPKINWQHSEGWILVGGQAVDRGFTVESLSVTYMPRGIGVGNADTLQQRARFFGYKRWYLGICRVFLEQSLRDSFEEYVRHEQIMREELNLIAASGHDLRAWRRRFVLDAALQPCRRAVVSDPLTRGPANGGWIQQRGALMSADAMNANAKAIQALIDQLSFSPDESYLGKSPGQQHLVCRRASVDAVLSLLLEYRCEDPRDTASMTGLMVTLGEILKRRPAAEMSVYQMRPTEYGIRTIKEDHSIDTFMQGRTRVKSGAYTYPGDGFFVDSSNLSLQLHRFDLQLAGRTLAKAAPLLAFHVPPALARDWIVQVQGGQDVIVNAAS